MKIDNNEGQYEKAYLNFYEDRNELKGIIAFENSAPGNLEVVGLNTDSIKLLAALRSHTATLKLTAAGDSLSGKSYYNKPLTYSFQKKLVNDWEISRMLAPKKIKDGKRVE